MTPAQEAAAMWGIAENPHFDDADRLACARKALDYYGARAEEFEKLEALAENWEGSTRALRQQVSVAARVAAGTYEDCAKELRAVLARAGEDGEDR